MAFARLKVVPVGSYEYHGTELPPDTDTVIAAAVARALRAGLGEAGVAPIALYPVLPYGFSPEHRGFPQTAWVGHGTYYSFVRELLFSIAEEADLLVVVNWHGGNVRSLAALENDFNYEHDRCKLFVPQLDPEPVQRLCEELLGEFDQHAGSVEASLMAFHTMAPARTYDAPQTVDLDGALRFFRNVELGPHGVVKRKPTIVADPEAGARIHAAIVAEVARSVTAILRDLEPFMPSAEASSDES